MKKLSKKKATKRTSEERSAAAKKAWQNRRMRAAAIPSGSPWVKPRSLGALSRAPTPEDLVGIPSPKSGLPSWVTKPKANGHFDLTAREAMQKVLIAMQRHADGENANARGMVEGAISGLVSSLGYLEG